MSSGLLQVRFDSTSFCLGPLVRFRCHMPLIEQGPGYCRPFQRATAGSAAAHFHRFPWRQIVAR